MSQFQPVSKKRIDSIDILRGMIMIVMALDHVRDFFHIAAVTGNPTDPATTTPSLFFTRWITHFCAPVFVFLAGLSAFLTGIKKTKKELSVFLLKRGFWLILIEIIVFNLLFSFDPGYHLIGLQVIWVTGISMILLAAFIYIPLNYLVWIGLIIVAGHNLLDNFNTKNGPVPVGWSLLHQQSFHPFNAHRFLFILYPIIPWPGIMLLGYCTGVLFAPGYDAVLRRRKLIRYGLTATLVFFILRAVNVYGDLFPWAEQKNTTATILSFFNVTKYPPSLLYCCMTLGPALIVLALIEKAKGKWKDIAVIYGRVPMFYYLIHFFIIHLVCMIIFFVNGHTMAEASKGSLMYYRPDDFGYSLGIVYLIWIAVVTALYPLCKWYSTYKASHNYWWLPYL